MKTTHCQRWREGRDRYRPVGETINTRRHEVVQLEGLGEARAFVEKHHYSHSIPAVRTSFGLYESGELVGVAMFSVPMSPKVITNALDVRDWKTAVELGRFVLLDRVPANGETWFLARCFRQLKREGYAGVVSYADPEPRTDVEGNAVFAGHLGTIYQASNAVYYGRAPAKTQHLLPDGTVFSKRAASKVRALERGHRYAASLLEQYGAPPLDDAEDPAKWLKRSMARVVRYHRHRGNHRYAWSFARQGGYSKKLVPAPYPKVLAPVQ